MNFKTTIFDTFGEKIFDRPLFYSQELALRLELSEPAPTYISQFLNVHQKAKEICREALPSSDLFLVGLRFFAQNPMKMKECLTHLRKMGVPLPKSREIWVLPPENAEEGSESSEGDWHDHILAFPGDQTMLDSLLWTALASDYGPIQPRPMVSIYIFNISKKIALFPYDDRGMDIVGPNKEFLRSLYHRFNHTLLDYDRAKMDELFG